MEEEVETEYERDLRVVGSVGMSAHGARVGDEAAYLAGFLVASQLAMKHPEWIQAFTQFTHPELVDALRDAGNTMEALVVATPVQRLSESDKDDLHDAMGKFLQDRIGPLMGQH